MTPHEWSKLSKRRTTNNSLGISTRDTAVTWKCGRCGLQTELWSGIRPADASDSVVNPDCDMTLVSKIMES
jgi:hypothetical protein